MAITYMSGQAGLHPKAYSFSYTSGNAQDPIVTHPRSPRTIFTISFADGGSAKMQTTTDTYEKVIAGTATWVDWSLGVISTTLQNWFFNPTAIRIYRVGGTVNFSVKDLGE